MALDAFDVDVTDTLVEMMGAEPANIAHAAKPAATPGSDTLPADAGAAAATAPEAPEVLAPDENEPPRVNLSAAFREWATISDMMDDLQEKMTVLAGRRSDVLQSILLSHGSGPFKFRGMELLIAKNKNGMGYCVRKMGKSPTVVE